MQVAPSMLGVMVTLLYATAAAANARGTAASGSSSSSSSSASPTLTLIPSDQLDRSDQLDQLDQLEPEPEPGGPAKVPNKSETLSSTPTTAVSVARTQQARLKASVIKCLLFHHILLTPSSHAGGSAAQHLERIR